MEANLGRYRFAVITVSDTRTETTDESGPAVEDALVSLGALQIERSIVRDEINDVREAVLDACSRCDVVFTTGGTGFSKRDVTPEATLSVLDKHAPGLSQLLLSEGARKTPMSWLSRGVAGLRGDTLIVNLPGSPKGAREAIVALAGVLAHVLDQISGGGHD